MDRHIDIIDYHVAGAPLRVIRDRRQVAGKTMQEKAAAGLLPLGPDRLLATQEPRAHSGMFAAFILDPVTPDADFAALICDAEPTSPFKQTCGHASIALAAAALDEAWVTPKSGANRITIDVPAGSVTLEVDWKHGRCGEIRYRHVPSTLITADHALGGIRGALVQAGPQVMLVDAEKQGIAPTPRAAFAVYQSMRGPATEPPPELVQFRWAEGAGGFRSISFFGPSGFDRSPCGTSTSALACYLAETGQLAEGQTFTNTTLFGTAFNAGFKRDTGLTPEILARAHRIGTARLILSADDPLTSGIALPDLS